MGSFIDSDTCNIWPGFGRGCGILTDKSELKNLNNAQFRATDALRKIDSRYNFLVSPVNFYEPFIESFSNNGYTEFRQNMGTSEVAWDALQRCENAREHIENNSLQLSETTLYVLGYDWRKKTEESAKTLKKLVDCVAATHHTKVDLVGHSMGGLVIKQFLLSTTSTNQNAAKFVK
jgi:hypothetical protein